MGDAFVQKNVLDMPSIRPTTASIEEYTAFVYKLLGIGIAPLALLSLQQTPL